MEEDDVKDEEKKDSRKPRVNIAMAAIMRKQEETNKQARIQKLFLLKKKYVSNYFISVQIK